LRTLAAIALCLSLHGANAAQAAGTGIDWQPVASAKRRN
jgi:hypothetical protein